MMSQLRYRYSVAWARKSIPIALWLFGLAGTLPAQTVEPRGATDRSGYEWEKSIPLTAFMKIDSLSGKGNYYSIETERPGVPFIHAHYVPPGEPTKLGYRLPDSFLGAARVTWQWRVHVPPRGADERKKGKNDSGAAIYIIFKRGFQTLIIKYVFSTTLPQGVVIRKDPFYPLQRMFVVVASAWNETEKSAWKQVAVDVKDDFCRLYASKTCPPLLGIGIMTDGDGTNSEVVADYRQFVLTGARK